MRQLAVLLGFGLTLSACAVAPDPNSLDFDPFEASNRQAHALNVPLDRELYGPVARGWGATVPPPVRHGITNLRNNWRLPGHVIQYTLQGRGTEVAASSTRFLVNTLFGLGGLLDVAVDMGLPYDETGFDETFFRWGVPEGGYLELPVVGPGTQRDWTAYVLDQATDPTWYVLPVAATNALLVLGGLDLVNERYELDPVMQSLMHESADSYTALRLSYLQNMRARLEGGDTGHELDEGPAQQGLTTRQAHLRDAVTDEEPDEPEHLLVGQHLGLRHPGQTLSGHAVGAAQVAAVGHRDAQVSGNPAELVPQTGLPSRPADHVRGPDDGIGKAGHDHHSKRGSVVVCYGSGSLGDGCS